MQGVSGYLSDKAFNEKQGARPLRRILQLELEDKLSDHLLKKGLRENVSVNIVLKNDSLFFSLRKLTDPLKKRKIPNKSLQNVS